MGLRHAAITGLQDYTPNYVPQRGVQNGLSLLYMLLFYLR